MEGMDEQKSKSMCEQIEAMHKLLVIATRLESKRITEELLLNSIGRFKVKLQRS